MEAPANDFQVFELSRIVERFATGWGRSHFARRRFAALFQSGVVSLELGVTTCPNVLITPDDVADAVMHAVTRPAHVHIPEIVIRPNKNIDLWTGVAGSRDGHRRSEPVVTEPGARSKVVIREGDVVPDVALVDHDANPWRFSDHRGRTLLLILHRHLA